MESFKSSAKIIGVDGNVATISYICSVRQHEVAYVKCEELLLKSEVIKVDPERAFIQIFDDTRGIKIGDEVLLTGELLSAQLGPGLLGTLFDGIQNPLQMMADSEGLFIAKGFNTSPLSNEVKWDFRCVAKKGDVVTGGDTLGCVLEYGIEHKIMVPFYLTDTYQIESIEQDGKFSVNDVIAVIRDIEDAEQFSLTMSFNWPIKKSVKCYQEKLLPEETLITGVRTIDTFFPIAKGGSYCIPGPFGSGKTVLQQLISRYAEIDIVIVAACGERANEVVDTIREFGELTDPKSGRRLMERTIIICNTSAMPVAARESSVYTAVTLAEYYRQMGLDVLLLADSTSRWAQAMRERSGRLEEIPGEEAFPAYLESSLASFYERAGLVKLNDGQKASISIGGTVSPAGGNFEEPVTVGTLKVVGAFHGLSQERADARMFPAIDPLDSWSLYAGVIEQEKRKTALRLFYRAGEIFQMMQVVGEEGISLEDYIWYLKSNFFDHVYLQQNAFNLVDCVTGKERQQYSFDLIWSIIESRFALVSKDDARKLFHQLRQLLFEYNDQEWQSDQFKRKVDDIKKYVADHKLDADALSRLPHRELIQKPDIDSNFRSHPVLQNRVEREDEENSQ